MKYFVYFLGAGMVLCAMFISGWISWVIAIIGVVLTYVASAIGEKETIGETDKTILALLFHAAHQDGEMAEVERQYILDYIKRRGLSNKQVKAVEAYASDPSKWKFSTDEDQKMRIIDEIIGLIKSDGVVTDEEKEYLKAICKAVNVDENKALERL